MVPVGGLPGTVLGRRRKRTGAEPISSSRILPPRLFPGSSAPAATRRPARRPAAALVLAALLAAVTTSCGAPAPEAAPPASPGATSAPATGRVVVIGDSLSTGMGTSPAQAWPSLLQGDSDSAGHHLQVTNAARNGSGYVRVGDGDATFDSEITASVGSDARAIMVFGSENDMGTEPAALARAAGSALAHARAAAPHAALIVVGPPSYTATPEPERLAVRDAVKSAADGAGAVFVDPIAAQWIVGHADTLIGPDGDHPSAAGQQYLKAKMEQILADQDLFHPVAANQAASRSGASVLA